MHLTLHTPFRDPAAALPCRNSEPQTIGKCQQTSCVPSSLYLDLIEACTSPYPPLPGSALGQSQPLFAGFCVEFYSFIWQTLPNFCWLWPFLVLFFSLTVQTKLQFILTVQLEWTGHRHLDLGYQLFWWYHPGFKARLVAGSSYTLVLIQRLLCCLESSSRTRSDATVNAATLHAFSVYISV